MKRPPVETRHPLNTWLHPNWSRQPKQGGASIRVLIADTLGLHARAAMVFAETASAFESSVMVQHDGRTADGRSVLQLLSLGAFKGDELEIRAEGEDADAAVGALRIRIENGFDAASP